MPARKNVLSFGFAVSFDEAIAAAERRGVKLPDEFYHGIPVAARSRAFTVSGLASLDQIDSVKSSLERATQSGATFEQWKRDALANIPQVAGLPPGRLDTIFRTNIQTHYSVGRTQQQRLNKDNAPYLMWDAINDSRTRPSHRAMDNHIAPMDDPIWKKWSPPAGFRCRCARIALTNEQAIARGYAPGTPSPQVMPDTGFDYEKADGFDEQLHKTAAVKMTQAKKKGVRVRKKDVVAADTPTGLAAAIDEANAYLLENGRKHKVEYAVLLDENGNRLFQKTTNDKHSVSFESAEVSMMKGCILLHNHPSGRSLSDADLFFCNRSGLREIKAIGHNDALYTAKNVKETVLKEYENVRAVVTASMDVLVSTLHKTDGMTQKVLDSFVDELNYWYAHVLNKSIAELGMMDYEAVNLPKVPAWVDTLTGEIVRIYKEKF